MKRCFKCNKLKSLSCFYKHKMMTDGHVNKCKDCNKKDVRKNREKNVEYYREYDKERGNRQSAEYLQSWRKKFPKKYKAQSMVYNAIKSKKLFKEPCEMCNSKKSVHAHHDDYSKPLNIRWLCAIHHREWHDKNGEGINGK